MRSRMLARSLLALLVLSLVSVSAVPAVSVTKKQVEEACADSKAALAELEQAKARFDEATRQYQNAYGELEAVTYQELQLRSMAEDHEKRINEIRDRVVQRAVEMYMSGGAAMTDMVFLASSVGELITGQEFLEVTSREDLAAVDDLAALKKELERLRVELRAAQDRLQALTADLNAWASEMEDAMNQQAALYRELRGECNRLYNEYQAQLARERALAAARARGAGGGIPWEATPGFICPMDRNAVSFINDWGFPRSGGRTHKGTDIFARMGQPVYAVADGTVRLRTGGLGGTAVWLRADYGISFYYAHLSGWAAGLSTGDRVTRGSVIGYNGNTGNARGGAPHVHFGMFPSGGSAVNPYPTLRRAC